MVSGLGAKKYDFLCLSKTFLLVLAYSSKYGSVLMKITITSRTFFKKKAKSKQQSSISKSIAFMSDAVSVSFPNVSLSSVVPLL